MPSFTPASVLTLIRTRSSRGTAPGLSGWTEALLLPLAEDPVLLPALTVFLEDIACGRLDESARIRLISCRLLPARKKDDGVRPIAISEVFLRLASSLSLRLLPPGMLSRLLAPLQLGLGSAAGAEAIIHKVQALLESRADHVLLSLDFVNGFNSMFRHTMLARLYDLPELSDLWRLADFCYGAPSPLHLFGREGPVTTLISQRGARQGCVLGTLLFCLGLQPALEAAARGLTKLSVSAYVDDVVAVGPIDQAATFFDRLSSLSLRTWASRFPYPSPLCCGPRPSPRLAPSAPGPPPTPFPFSSAQRLFWALLLALIPRAGSGSLLSVFAHTSPSSRLFVIPSSPLKPPSSSYGSVLSPVSFSLAGPYLPVSLLLRAPPSTSSLFARPPPSCGWTLSQYPVKCAFRCPCRCVSEAWDFVLWLLLPPPPSSALSPPPLPTCSLRISRPRPLSLQISSMPSRWFASSPV